MTAGTSCVVLGDLNPLRWRDGDCCIACLVPVKAEDVVEFITPPWVTTGRLIMWHANEGCAASVYVRTFLDANPDGRSAL